MAAFQQLTLKDLQTNPDFFVYSIGTNKMSQCKSLNCLSIWYSFRVNIITRVINWVMDNGWCPLNQYVLLAFRMPSIRQTEDRTLLAFTTAKLPLSVIAKTHFSSFSHPSSPNLCPQLYSTCKPTPFHNYKNEMWVDRIYARLIKDVCFGNS